MKVENTVADGTLAVRSFDGFVAALTFCVPEICELRELVEWLAQCYDVDLRKFGDYMAGWCASLRRWALSCWKIWSPTCRSWATTTMRRR